MNKREVRIVKILQKMKEDPFVSIAELAEIFSVSQMTIRRDLQYIEKNELGGREKRTSGGRELSGNAAPAFSGTVSASLASYLSGTGDSGQIPRREYTYDYEEVHCVEEKKRINAFAVSLLRPGDVIVLDSGTTAGMMPEMIPDDLPLTVICYSYYIVSKLCDKPNIRLILAGGYYHRNTRIFSSEEGIRFMKQLRAQKVFLCASGIHADMGLTCTDQYIGDLKKAAISMSLEKILITDSTKFGKVDPGFFAAIEDMDRIITDSGISEEWTDLIRAKRIQLDIV
jgi:DeoR family deoxyribose operon repressor